MLQVEVTNRCNLNCRICSRYSQPLDLGEMSPELRDRVAELSASVQEVFLFGYGEPLVSRAFFDLLPRLRSSRISFFTNGMLMDGAMYERILGLARRPLGTLVFSVDGASAPVFESIRLKGSLERVWNNLREVIAVRQEHGSGPYIRLEFVAMRRNVEELAELVARADEAGVDAIKVSHLVVWDEDLLGESLLDETELCAQAFAKARTAALGRRIRLDLPKVLSRESALPRAPLPPCLAPWTYAMISWSGEVRACCFAPDWVMGNLCDEPFDVIWNREPYQRLRRVLNTPDSPAVCCRCEERFRLVKSPDEQATYLKLRPREK